MTADEWLVHADLAMYDAKELGRDRVEYFASVDRRHPRITSRLSWLDKIERALDHEGFALVSMPIIDLTTDTVECHELLLRMSGDDGELIRPASFMSVAERFDIVGRIDRWVVTRAIEILSTNTEPSFELAVNVSATSLVDGALIPVIDGLLREHAVAPSRLTFELTETAAVGDVVSARHFAEQLRTIGCRFALDDFGAGFGSFYYLKHLPFDFLKIDGEFVRDCAHNEVDRLIIANLVALAHGLGKQTIAEHTVDAATLAVLRALHVDLAQGYHIGKPTPIESGFAWAGFDSDERCQP